MDALRSSSQQLHQSSLRRSLGERAEDAGPDGGDRERAPERDTYQQAAPHVADLSEEEERAEGARQEAELLSRHARWDCQGTAQRLSEMRDLLLGRCRRDDVSYRFLALQADPPFASSCSHGAVYFSRGLLSELDDSQVLFFAAHEMAHTELRHYASRQRRLEELRRTIPAAPGSAARQRLELAAVLAVRHQEEFEADHLAARWLDHRQGESALGRLHGLCRSRYPESLQRPTHPPFEQRLTRMARGLPPPEPVDYLWSLIAP